MASSEHDQTLGQVAVEATVKAVAEVAAGTAGRVAVTFLSEFGKEFYTYWQSKSAGMANSDDVLQKDAPFAVVGLGRCGTHVTAQLARMVMKTLDDEGEPARKPRPTLWGRFFGANRAGQALTPEPFMVVGDLAQAIHDACV